MSRGIYLWELKAELYHIDSQNQYPVLKQLLRHFIKIRCRIRIVDKRGLPFILYRYRRRKMLAVGMLVCLQYYIRPVILCLTVDVEGTEEADPRMVLAELESLG